MLELVELLSDDGLVDEDAVLVLVLLVLVLLDVLVLVLSSSSCRAIVKTLNFTAPPLAVNLTVFTVSESANAFSLGSYHSRAPVAPIAPPLATVCCEIAESGFVSPGRTSRKPSSNPSPPTFSTASATISLKSTSMPIGSLFKPAPMSVSVMRKKSRVSDSPSSNSKSLRPHARSIWLAFTPLDKLLSMSAATVGLVATITPSSIVF